MKSWDDEFRQLYREMGLMKGNVCLPLHEACYYHNECWKDRYQYAPNEPTSQIARPWVGQFYLETKLLAIGINLREGGGFYQHVCEVEVAKELIKQGRTRIHRSYFHFGLSAYSSTLLSKMKIELENRAVAFDYIAYLQHVKCSPTKDASGAPFDSMWRNCEDFILEKEIKKLDPSLILVIGKYHYDNILGMFERLGYKEDWKTDKKPDDTGVRFALLESRAEHIPIISVYHPNYFRKDNPCKAIIEKAVSRLETIEIHHL